MDTKDKVKAALVIAIMGAAIIGDLFTDSKSEWPKATTVATSHTRGYDYYHGYNPVKIGESTDSIDYEAEYIRKYETKKVAKPAKKQSKIDHESQINDYSSRVNDLEETIDDLNAEIDRLNSILDRVTD